MVLTREQVEQLGDFLCEENLSQTAEKFLAHDAALRERVRVLEQDNATLNKQFQILNGSVHIHYEEKVSAQAQLAALTTAHQQAVKERDDARAQYAACHTLHIEAMEQCEEKNIMMLTLRAVGAEQEVIALQASLQQAVEALAGVTEERDDLRFKYTTTRLFGECETRRADDLQAKLQAVEAALKYMADENSWSVEDGSYQMRRPGGSQHIGIFISSHFLNPWRFAQEALGLQGEAGHE